jgi:CheY-like chemotaxis protein
MTIRPNGTRWLRTWTARWRAYTQSNGLPDEDGCEVLEKFRNLYAVKASTLTGYGMPADIAEFREAGFDIFLRKPVELNDLET